MKIRTLALALAALGITSFARADYNPIAINPASFNQDPVIEAAAPKTINDTVTATPDTGTNKFNNTWFEVGYVTNSAGLPAHGSLVAAVSDANHTFRMPPDYHTNNCVFVGHNNGAWSPIMGPGTLTLTTPAQFTTISVLSTSGNGSCLIHYTINYQGGATEEGDFSSTDWWSGNAPGRVYDAAGLVSLNAGANTINNLATNHGVLFYADIPVGQPTVNITSVTFEWRGQNATQNPWSNGRTCIFGLSGSTDGTVFSPVDVSGFNQDVVVEADAPKTFGSAATSVTGTLTNDNTYCTMTMDGGNSKGNYTWFEQGYYASYPNSGLPVAGSTISSAKRPYIHYTMPSTYAGPCAVGLSSNAPTANIRFQTPAAYGGLSLLLGDGNGVINMRAEIQFQDGTVETNWISGVDWFNRTDAYAYACWGQTQPGCRFVRNTPDQFANYFQPAFGQPFLRDPRNGGASTPNVPNIRIFDVLLPVTNSSALITNVALATTNQTAFTTTVAIFAISGNSGTAPSITEPAGLVTDAATGVTNLATGVAQGNNIVITKGYQGSNNISLYVSNRLGNAVSYQWKRAPRGGGWRDIYDTYDMSTFVDVTGPNIGGITSNVLTISNATLADTADYVVVASNPYGSYTSFVASVMVMTTNGSVLLGAANGDIITKYTADTDSGAAAENFNAASDQVQQKWLSRGTGTNGYNATPIAFGTVPFVGPAGYVITPVSGASFVNAIRFYCANDGAGRDPRDYTLEGSNDGSTWTRITGGTLLGTLMLPTARGGTGATQLNPMTQPLMEVDFANPNSYKSYRVTITNNIEPDATALMQIAEIQLLGTFVPAPPTWVRQPDASVIAYVGTSPTFAAKASGLGSLAPKYQWFKSPGTAISGATSSILTLSNVQLTDSGSSYYCVATNAFGGITSSSGTLTVIAAPTQSYPAAVLANTPLGYWRLNEPDNAAGNNGVVAHDYVGGHNGYYSNTVNGVSGYSPSFDPDSAMQVGAAADQLVNGINDVNFGRVAGSPGATFSVEAWAFGNDQTVDAAIVAKGYNGILNPGVGTGAEQYALDVTGGTPRKFRFLVRGDNGQGYQAQSTIIPSVVNPSDPLNPLPAWHHLLGVCDQPNGTVKLYVDGVLAGQGTIPSTAGIIAQALPTTIGSRPSSSIADFDNQWSGTIDDVAIYGSALSASQALAHYYAGQRPPIITLQPTNQTTPENVIVSFYTAAYGAGTLGYQWYLSDGINPTNPVAGQTSATLSFNTSVSQSGNNYQLIVTNQFGATTSVVAQLTVVGGAPSFATDIPSAQTVLLGHVLQLRVDPLGTAPFTFQWKKDGVNIVNDYRTSGAQTSILTIGYATNTDSGNYQVIVNNGQGSTPSTTCALLVTNVTSTAVPFTAAATGWSLQGTTAPIMGANRLEMTSNLGSTDRSAFMTAKQNITTFAASFVYTLTTGAGGADGVTFCIQNAVNGAAQRGGGGGGLGYSGNTPSIALAMNIYDPNTRGIRLLQNGIIPPAGAGAYAPITPVLLGGNANPIQVNITYAGGNLTASFRDIVANTTFTTNFSGVDIAGTVGDSLAYVGFTGADGGVASTQVLSNFVMVPPPVTIKSTRVGNSLVLNWPASAGAFLRSTPSLLNPVWSYDTSQFLVVSNQAQVTIAPFSGDSRFYRLDVYP